MKWISMITALLLIEITAAGLSKVVPCEQNEDNPEQCIVDEG
jgi:hypothetical protein